MSAATVELQTLENPLRRDEEGNIRVGRSRVTLKTVIAYFNQGDTPETIAQNFDTLELADIYLVIAFYLRHKPEVDEFMARQEAEGEEFRRAHPQLYATNVRERLIARWQARESKQ